MSQWCVTVRYSTELSVSMVLVTVSSHHIHVVTRMFQFPIKMLIAPWLTVFTLEHILDFINNWKNDTDISIRSCPYFFEFYWTSFIVACTYASWLVLAATAESFATWSAGKHALNWISGPSGWLRLCWWEKNDLFQALKKSSTGSKMWN